jgi:hypothetical protein
MQMHILAILVASSVALLRIGAVPAQQQKTVEQQQTQAAQESPPAPEEVTPDPWPKTVEQSGAKYTVYQPQLESWNGYALKATAAVSVLPQDAKVPVYGVIDIAATTIVDKTSRTVEFRNITVSKSVFPSAPDKAERYCKDFQAMVKGGPSTMSLDRLDAMLAIQGAEKKARAVPVKNEPPKFVFARSAAVLVPIDGTPVWRTVAGTSLERAVNTRTLLLMDDSSGTFYLHLFDGFVQAPALKGPWTVAKSVPDAARKLAEKLSKQNVVDLLEGVPEGGKKPSLAKLVPQVVVATGPTELIVTQGPPVMEPMLPLMLLYVKNTTADVFIDLNDQHTYVLAAGRWFRAPGFKGPWQYVAGKDLPADFAKIPDNSPKENVKAAIPGTAQAREAVIENEIPQTAIVYPDEAKFTPAIHGEPVLAAIPGTDLRYVRNSADPIIEVSPEKWYAVKDGVWFTASSVKGPWKVAKSVPADIYSIPPSSPLYYVTYVKIYAATDDYIIDGYTSGYLGAVVSPDGTLVYGTGYDYPAYVAEDYWYPAPVTYGYAANPTWTPWTGWAYGYGLGWGWAAAGLASNCWGYAPAPYWGAAGYAAGKAGAAAWGPNGWAATTGNVYRHWGASSAVSRSSSGYNAWTGNEWSRQVGYSYNSTTGRISRGQRAEVQNVYTGNTAHGARGATYKPATGVTARGGYVSGEKGTAGRVTATGPGGQRTTAAKAGDNVYAGHDGNVYRNTGSGWEKYSAGGWNSVKGTSGLKQLDSELGARRMGDVRSSGASWGSSNWGGGFSRGERPRGGLSGGERFGGGGFNGGWDRGGFNRGGFQGGRNWGGGGFGDVRRGGGSHGGGFRRGGRR